VQDRRTSLNDEWGRLMRLALDGDQVAYRTLLAAIAPYLRGSVRRLLTRSGRGTADVEDIVQDTLLAIHLKRTSWDRSLPFAPWLNAVVRYKTIDALRRRNIYSDVDLESVSETIASEDSDTENAMDSQRMLNALQGRDREIVNQMVIVGRSAADVGQQLGMSEGAVRVALHRSIKRLAKTFKVERNEH
jgi:RNA polymerase sigma-70 factor, ECF subfamily